MVSYNPFVGGEELDCSHLSFLVERRSSVTSMLDTILILLSAEGFRLVLALLCLIVC